MKFFLQNKVIVTNKTSQEIQTFFCNVNYRNISYGLLERQTGQPRACKELFHLLRHGIVHTPHTHTPITKKCLKYDWFLAHNQRAESQTILFRNLKFEIFGSV